MVIRNRINRKVKTQQSNIWTKRWENNEREITSWRIGLQTIFPRIFSRKNTLFRIFLERSYIFPCLTSCNRTDTENDQREDIRWNYNKKYINKQQKTKKNKTTTTITKITTNKQPKQTTQTNNEIKKYRDEENNEKRQDKIYMEMQQRSKKFHSWSFSCLEGDEMFWVIFEHMNIIR